MRTLYSTCSNMARISFWRDAGPPLTSASHIKENLESILAKASLTHWRIGRSGWSAGTKFSSLTMVTSDSLYPSAPACCDQSWFDDCQMVGDSGADVDRYFNGLLIELRWALRTHDFLPLLAS